LEMSALRRLTTAAFGTLMCLEPALALLAGLALLGQVPQVWALVGVALVVAAGLGAVRTGARQDETHVRIGSERVGVAALYSGGAAWLPRCGQAGRDRGQRGQERGPAGPLLNRVPGPPGRVAEQQPLPRPGHPDEQQPSFLGRVLRGERPCARQPERQQAALAA